MQEYLLSQRQELRPLPIQIQANTILALNTLDLQRFVESEAAENPALTIDDTARCSVCGFLRAEKTCPVCGSLAKQRGTSFSRDDERMWLKRLFATVEDEPYEPFKNVAATTDLREHLKSQARLMLEGPALRVAQFIVDSIDDDGYFRESLYETAERFGLAVPEVESVLRVVQTFDPPGIAARDLRECLLIQLRTLERSDSLTQITERVISNYWEDFSRLKLKQIATKLRTTVDILREVQQFIRTNLNPYPASGFHHPPNKMQPCESAVVVPDVAVIQRDGELIAQPIDWLDRLIGLDKTYERVYRLIREQTLQLDEDERRHVKEYVERARSVLESIQLRKRTLALVANRIIEHQREYILKGASYLKPLRQKEIAQELGLAESTVSRALANKYCRLPSEEVVSFEVFFDAALPVREMISRLISISPRPLSDSEIVKHLAEQGVVVARRTVAKYRNQLRVPAYRFRAA